MIDNLPSGWILSTLGEVCTHPQYGYTTSASDTGTLRLLRTTDITSGKIDWGTVPYCSENPDDEKKYLLEDGDIVISRAGSIGVSYLLESPEKSVFASYLIRFRAFINRAFFKYFLESPYYWQEISENKLGIAIPNVNATKLQVIPLPLPPLNEQRRIVAKIEELFSELDKGIENLQTAREQFKIYRQAVLKHAFEGKLTAHWREGNKDKLESPALLLDRIRKERDKWLDDEARKGNNEAKRLYNKPRKISFNKPKRELPKFWQWTSFSEALQAVVDCHNKTAPYENSGIYLVRTSNIRNGKIDLKNDIRFVSESTYQYWSRRCPPKSGDILFTREAPMGEACIIPGDAKVCMGQRIMLLRSFPKLLNTEYLLYSILSPEFQSLMMNSAIGTGVKHLRVGDVEKLVFPICSPEEQEKIVLYLDEKFSAIEALEQDIEQNLQKAEALRQSILKKAFSGKLVAQDPSDEPASLLLERIRAEKTAVSTPKKQTRRKAVA